MSKNTPSPFTVARQRALLRRELDLDRGTDDEDDDTTERVLDRAMDRALEATYADASGQR